MEKGFFHPNRGYWQTISDPDAQTVATYPEGTIEVPLKPGADFEWINGAWQSVPQQTPEEVAAAMIEAFRLAVDAHVDATAKSKGYNSAANLSGYATSTVHKWASEAAAFISWRDQVWLTAFDTLAKVESGQLQQPTIEELLTSLPVINWPT